VPVSSLEAGDECAKCKSANTQPQQQQQQQPTYDPDTPAVYPNSSEFDAAFMIGAQITNQFVFSPSI
jgi:hypothetical protein